MEKIKKTVKRIIKIIVPHSVLESIKNTRNKINNNLNIYKEKKNNKKIVINAQRRYKKIEKSLYNRGNRPLRFAFYVMYATDFGESEVFSIMASDSDFIAKLVVVPDIARGKEHLKKTYNETKQFLIEKFGSEYILDGYDINSDTFYDYSEDFDIISLNCPYREMSHEYHQIEYLSKKNVLTIYGVYSFLAVNYHAKTIFPRLDFSLLWKCFLDTEYSLPSCKKNTIYHGKNAVVFGYSKMDGLAKYENITNQRKKIILAPHHTINTPALPLSNFLSYYDLILELPDLFPNVDFVFRPHPLLFVNLVNKKYWTENQVSEYIKKLNEKGIVYSYSGGYFDLFASSDAIIHDCGSYITEWLFTGKPCCFVAKDNTIFDFFSELGKESIKYYTIAYSREQIIEFINNVVLNKNIKKYSNSSIINNKIMLNYPNVSKKIVDFLRLRKNNRN